MEKSRTLIRPSLRAGIDGRRIHRHPELAAEDLAVGIGEAEERAGVGGFQIDQSRPCARPRKSAVTGVSRPILPVSVKVLIDAVAPRQLGIDAAHRLAVVAGDRAELDVEIEIDVLGLALGVGFLARDRRLEEAAAVEHVAAHRHLHDAVGMRSAFSEALSPSEGG